MWFVMKISIFLYMFQDYDDNNGYNHGKENNNSYNNNKLDQKKKSNVGGADGIILAVYE